MNMLGHRLGIACGAILSALALAHSAGAAQPVAPPPGGLVRISPVSPKPRAARVVPPESLELKSISTLGNEPVALLSVKPPSPISRQTALDVGLQHGLWFTTGDSFFDYAYTVKAIARDHVILVQPSTLEIKIPLASTSSTVSDAKPYSKAWINSPANPMLLYAQPMPGRMYGGILHPLASMSGSMHGGNWDQLPGKKKKQVVEFYRKHGWLLIPVKTGPGPTEFEWRNLYEAERAAAIKANHEKFEQTLTPEQRGLWKEISSFQRVYPAVPGVFTDELKAISAYRQSIIGKFKASLSPEQKAEHEGLDDFTKASWR